MEVHQHRPALLSLVVAGGLLVALASACSPPNTTPLASLQAMEEGSLFYPGSVRLGEVAQPEEHGMDGVQPAEYGHQLGSNASATDIEQFHASELAKRGWTSAQSNDAMAAGIRGTTELSARAWEDTNAIFRLSFPKKGDDPRLPAASAQRAFTTIYEAVILDKPHVDGTPSPS